MPETLHVAVPTGARVTIDRCEVADTFVRRFRGLMGRRDIGGADAMVIRPAGSVHTFFMRFPIDVVYRDRDDRVVKVVEALRPWRMSAARGAKSVVELPAGDAARRGIEEGVMLEIHREGNHHG